ncbi:MAG TPA: DUF362 domain-containing protein [Candidatus Deferrimicrobium sp.]|nr:DUF362 domain-containing protein [Candidatus Deferrimicrobium sp.]
MTQVAIVRGNNPYETTYEALNLISEDIRVPKSHIIIKPNLLMTETFPVAVTTPQVCAAVAEFLKERKGVRNIQLGEGSTSGNPPDTYESMQNNGYLPYQDLWDPISFINDVPRKWFPIYSSDYSRKVELGISRTVSECPYLISIPKFKTHDVLGLTLSLKNLMGTLTTARDIQSKKILAQETTNICAFMHGFGTKKPHQLTDEQNTNASKVALAINLIRLARAIRPSLAVLDALVAMEGNGPVHGTKKNLNLIIASTDFIAADTVATYIAGMDPQHFQYIYQAGEIGLGENHLNKISILGEPLNNVISPFRPHHLFQRSQFSTDQIITLKSNIN